MKFIKFKPARRLIHLMIVLVIIGLISSIWPETEIYWGVFAFIILLFSLIDLWMVFKIPAPSINRSLTGTLSVGVKHQVKLSVKNNYQSSLVVDIYDHFPEQAHVEGLPRRLLLDRNEMAELTYFLKPLKRGKVYLEKIECLVSSPYSIWQYTHILPVADEVRVYPNWKSVV